MPLPTLIDVILGRVEDPGLEHAAILRALGGPLGEHEISALVHRVDLLNGLSVRKLYHHPDLTLRFRNMLVRACALHGSAPYLETLEGGHATEEELAMLQVLGYVWGYGDLGTYGDLSVEILALDPATKEVMRVLLRDAARNVGRGSEISPERTSERNAEYIQELIQVAQTA